jgi:hypothetical protein
VVTARIVPQSSKHDSRFQLPSRLAHDLDRDADDAFGAQLPFPERARGISILSPAREKGPQPGRAATPFRGTPADLSLYHLSFSNFGPVLI